MQATPPWRVLLVGGASGVGKTVAARVLARRLGVSQLYVDDIRMAIQRMITPEQHPALFYFLQPQVWQQPPDALLNGFIGVAKAIVPALEAIIAHHVGVPSVDPVLIEGDVALPPLSPRLLSSTISCGVAVCPLMARCAPSTWMSRARRNSWLICWSAGVASRPARLTSSAASLTLVGAMGSG